MRGRERRRESKIFMYTHTYTYVCIVRHPEGYVFDFFWKTVSRRLYAKIDVSNLRHSFSAANISKMHIPLCDKIHITNTLRSLLERRSMLALLQTRHFFREVGGWGRDPKKCTGRDWGMGSSTIQWNLRPVVKYHLRRGVGFQKFLENGSRPQPPTSPFSPFRSSLPSSLCDKANIHLRSNPVSLP